MPEARTYVGILIGGVAFGLWAEVLGIGGHPGGGGPRGAITATIPTMIALAVFLWDDRILKRLQEDDK